VGLAGDGTFGEKSSRNRTREVDFVSPHSKLAELSFRFVSDVFRKLWESSTPSGTCGKLGRSDLSMSDNGLLRRAITTGLGDNSVEPGRHSKLPGTEKGGRTPLAGVHAGSIRIMPLS
jgi:hypothetical protein